MNTKITFAMVVILAALGTYTFVYESKPKDATPSSAPDEVSLLKFDSNDLKGFTVTGSDGTLSVVRTNGKWENAADHKALDTDKIDSPLRPFQDLKSRRKVLDKPTSADKTTFGLDHPQTTITFDWKDGKNKTTSLVTGHENFEKNGLYAQANPSDTVYVVDSYGVNQLAGLIKHPPYPTPTPKPTAAPASAAQAVPVPAPSHAPGKP